MCRGSGLARGRTEAASANAGAISAGEGLEAGLDLAFPAGLLANQSAKEGGRRHGGFERADDLSSHEYVLIFTHGGLGADEGFEQGIALLLTAGQHKFPEVTQQSYGAAERMALRFVQLKESGDLGHHPGMEPGESLGIASTESLSAWFAGFQALDGGVNFRRRRDEPASGHLPEALALCLEGLGEGGVGGLGGEPFNGHIKIAEMTGGIGHFSGPTAIPFRRGPVQQRGAYTNHQTKPAQGDAQIVDLLGKPLGVRLLNQKLLSLQQPLVLAMPSLEELLAFHIPSSV